MQPLVLGLLLGLTLLAGCSDPGGAHDEPTETYDIAIHNTQFDPRSLLMPAGHTLRFENHEAVKHTAQTADGMFSSGDIAVDGGSHSFIDMPAGTYVFTCKYHAGMRLTVTVEGS